MSLFLELPPYLRDDIYRLLLEYPKLNPSFERCEKEEDRSEAKKCEAERLRPHCTLPYPRPPPMRTPPILLVCRQITAEALPILRNTTFVLDREPPYSEVLGREMNITDFIGEETLKEMEHVELRLDIDGRPRVWSWTIDLLLDVWAAGHSLKRLTVWGLEGPGSPGPPPMVNLRNFQKSVWGNKATSKV